MYLMGTCGYSEEDDGFGKNAPISTGIALFQREAGDEIRDYIRVQSYGDWDEKIEDSPFHEEWFEVRGPNLILVDPEKKFKPVK